MRTSRYMAKTHTAMKKRRPSKSPSATRGKPRAQRVTRTSRKQEPRARAVLALPAEVTLAEAEGLKLRLMRLAKSVTPVTVELSAVRRIDTASMQLVAAFVRDRAAGALPTRLLAASSAFLEGARLLGLAALLEGPSETA